MWRLFLIAGLAVLCVRGAVAAPEYEALQAKVKCVQAVLARPEVAELMLTLGGEQDLPTPAQLSNDVHASAKDSGVAMLYIEGVLKCGAAHPDDPIIQIMHSFAIGVSTYSETTMYRLLYMAQIKRKADEITRQANEVLKRRDEELEKLKQPH
jgi:hypothetical protein